MNLPILSPSEATRLGFKSFTTAICRRTEKHIIEGIEMTLAPVGGCWIDLGKNKLEAARKNIVQLGRRAEGEIGS